MDAEKNEIRVAKKGLIKKYMGYAFKVLNKFHYRTIKIRATGNAIVKALILIELIKRREKNLYQINNIFSVEKITYEEPKIEGLDPIPNSRRITALDALLSKDPLDKNHFGYQFSIEEEV